MLHDPQQNSGNGSSRESISNDRIERQKPSNLKKRSLGLTIILIEIGILIAYIFEGEYYSQPSPSTISQTQGIITILLIILIVLAFTLLFSIFKFGSWLGSTAIIMVTIVIQLGPLLQNFFFNGIVLEFLNQPEATNVSDEIKTFWRHFQKNSIDLDYITLRTAIYVCVSLLTAVSAFIGRITLSQIIKMTIVFSVFWNLNYFLLIKVAIQARQNYSPVFFDIFGGSYIFLFGSLFTFSYNFFMWKQKLPVAYVKNFTNNFSLCLANSGAIIFFILFSLLENPFISYQPICSSLAVINTEYALVGSIIGTCLFSALIGKGRISYHEFLVGILSGGVMISSAALILQFAGQSIAVGLGIGIVTGIYIKIIDKKINKYYVYDSLGMIGPFFIASMLGSYVVAPLSLVNRQIQCSQSIVEGNNYAGYILIYPSITMGVSLIGGAICGIFNIFDKEELTYAQNTRYFLKSNGLIEEAQSEENHSLIASDWQNFDGLMKRNKDRSKKRREESRIANL